MSGMKNHRNSERFCDFARIDCDKLCVMSGVLTDISINGIRAEFNAPCDVDPDKEYEISLRMSRISAPPFELLVRPMWSDFSGGKTAIGFSLLPSKDSARLGSYIEKLRSDSSSDSYSDVISGDSDSLFI